MSQINQAVEQRKVEYLAFNSDEKITMTLEMVRNRIAAPAYTKAGEQVLISEREAIAFMMLCRARRLNPWEGDAFAIPFWDNRVGCHKWSLITAHNAFLKRAEANKEYEGMESGVIVEIDGSLKDLEGDFVPDTLDGEKVKLVGGWAKVHRKDRKIPTSKRVKLTTFQQSYGRWTSDPAGMIVKCAEADALRSSFPNTLGGMYLKEEQAVEVQASVEQVPERRPEFGQQSGNLVGPTPRARSRIAEKTAEKPPQDASGQQPATPSQPPQESNAAPAEPPAQGTNEANGNLRNEPENPPAETTAEPPPTVPPGEDLSTPPEAEETQTNQPPTFVPDTRDTVPTQDVKRLCHESGITLEMLMFWAVAKKIAKPGQKLNELAESKLINIKAQWPTLLPIIKSSWAKDPK